MCYLGEKILKAAMEARNREIGKERGEWSGEGNHLI